ncbi:aqualysin-1-like [Apostichopus japonicus]|uniref:aqualysin-1-like n=1 Tax=Stichopus japonicus TaxID=307972 RepID=UPI003AB29E35
MRLLFVCTLLIAASIVDGRIAPMHKARAEDKIDGSYFVVFQDGVDVQQGIADIRSYLEARFIPTGVVKRQFNLVFKGFTGTFSDITIQTIRRLPFIKFVEEDQIMRVMSVDSWGLDRIDDRELASMDGEYSPHYNGTGVTVYVIDTGVLTTHVDFEGRALHGRDMVDDDDISTDCNGHGTHCSGTVAGKRYGVAKKANIVGVRVLGCLGFGSNEDVVGGMEWALGDSPGKVAVASMSLGGGPSLATDNAVAALAAGNVFITVAAGNDDGDACLGSPARATDAMTVGATDDTDNIASFSNYGMCVNIFAPGVAITSSWIGSSDDAINTISGTSMACPHVAGAAALIREQSPSATVPEVIATLYDNGTPDCIIGLDDGFTINVLLHVHKKFEV